MAGTLVTFLLNLEGTRVGKDLNWYAKPVGNRRAPALSFNFL